MAQMLGPGKGSSDFRGTILRGGRNDENKEGDYTTKVKRHSKSPNEDK
jgi:hypothetical protein